MSGPEADQLRLEIRGRRLALLLALCTLVRGAAVSDPEQVVLAAAVDLLAQRQTADPTVPDVLAVLEVWRVKRPSPAASPASSSSCES